MVHSTVLLFITEKMQLMFTNPVERSPTSLGISDTGSEYSKEEESHKLVYLTNRSYSYIFYESNFGA